MDKQGWYFVVFASVVIFTSMGLVVGFLFGFSLTDEREIAECKAYFDERMENTTSACVEMVKRDVDWDAIMAECRKCEDNKGED